VINNIPQMQYVALADCVTHRGVGLRG